MASQNPAPRTPQESLPEVRAQPRLRPGTRILWRSSGKGAKDHQQRGSKDEPVSQTPGMHRPKVPEKQPRALPVGAGFSTAALLSSALLGAASFSPQRDYSFWQDIPEVKSRGLLEGLPSQQRHLQEAMFEVITSEASYLRSLRVALFHFQLSPALRGALAGAQLQQLFSNLSQVKDTSERFLLQLEDHLDQDVFLSGLGEVVLKHCPAFHRVYVPYVTNQMYQEQLMQWLMKGNSRFTQVLRALEEHPICQRQPLKAFLVLPFQRITRLKILLQNILKWARPESELAKSVGLAHEAVGEIVSQCNENVQLMKQKEELVSLEKRMDFSKVNPLPHFSQGRWLVREGELRQVLVQEAGLGYRPQVSMKPIHLHLFNDLLMLSHLKEDGRFLVKDYAWTGHVKAELFKAKPLGLPGWTFYLSIAQNHRDESREVILKAESEAQRQDWIAWLASR
ncbi:rho guanine nucleotide exchange factor 19 isoform X2 [Crotalus tigris]|uniref:rho guanine nucleotide exchange factor 19 isoform X2 n=1 Tax=Crotalus tigris TaxID=88082 RepID=UPI00192F157E|nr:rho guanine nucleotide exchange factor 19 isoform X2 [Crotalus tigris]